MHIYYQTISVTLLSPLPILCISTSRGVCLSHGLRYLPSCATDGQPGAENDNPPADAVDEVADNEPAPQAGEGANQWWGIVKEIQMIVFGFITSLLPGFHNMDHA